MRDSYKILTEKYMSVVDTEQSPDLTESNSIDDQSLYELTHDYLVGKGDETLMHSVNRAKDLNGLLRIAFNAAHEVKSSTKDAAKMLAQKLNNFSEDTMPVEWLEGKINKAVNDMTHESGMPLDPEAVTTGSTQDYPQEVSVEAKKKEVKKKEEKKPFSKNPYVNAVGDRWKGLSK